jgi:hypothetical protein
VVPVQKPKIFVVTRKVKFYGFSTKIIEKKSTYEGKEHQKKLKYLRSKIYKNDTNEDMNSAETNSVN